MVSLNVKRFDIYRSHKVPNDLTEPTVIGAIISIVCILLLLLLFSSELIHFLNGEVISELYVDNPGSSNDRIPVYIKIALPKLKCDYVGLDIQDDMGRHEVGMVENSVKEPIDETGCLFEASFHINKVPGNFHVSTHSADKQPTEVNFAHVIQELRFGSDMKDFSIPGSFNTLRQVQKIDGSALDSYEYIMKVVPTVYEDISGKQTISYQYTYATRKFVSFGHGGRVIPAVWFRYDLTPITVKYHQTRPPFYTFITTFFAIIGGTYTVASIIDSIVFTASEVFRKFEIGKLS